MGVFPVSATHHAARTPPTPATNLKLNAGASRRRRPPPRSCSPAPIPRRNDARRDALSGETPPPEASSRPAVVLLSAEDVAERPLDAVLAHPLLLRRRNACPGGRRRERKLDGKALERSRAPRRACSPVPLVRQTTSSVWRAAPSERRRDWRSFHPPRHASLIKRREPRAPLSFLRGAFSVARFFPVDRGFLVGRERDASSKDFYLSRAFLPFFSRAVGEGGWRGRRKVVAEFERVLIRAVFFVSSSFLFLTIFFRSQPRYRAAAARESRRCVSVVLSLSCSPGKYWSRDCCDCGLACCSPASSRGGEINLIGGGKIIGERLDWSGKRDQEGIIIIIFLFLFLFLFCERLL